MKVLVTGASGFLGGRLIELLIQEKFKVKALVRKSSNKEKLQKLSVELFEGDLADPESLNGIMDDVSFVIHGGAVTTGPLEDYKKGTINGTDYILKLAQDAKVKQFVHISSLSVYDLNSIPKDSLINERYELERNPKAVGPYGYSKTESEKIASEYAKKSTLPVSIVRPGIIYGSNRDLFFPHLGFMALGGKIVLKIGMEKKLLPLTYIDNTCDVIIKLLSNTESNGKIYNIVDPQTMTYKQYLKYFLTANHMRSIVLPIPYPVFKFVAFGCEIMSKFPVIGSKFGLTRYRLNSKFKKVRFDGSLVMRELNWYPKISLTEGLKRSFV